MKCEEIRVDTIDALSGALRGLADPANSAVCRGQALASWRLQPSIDRGVPPGTAYKKRLDEEWCLIKQFCRRVKNLLGVQETHFIESRQPSDIILPLTVMQHYGAPTRMLDWTDSPFAAAFFAVIDSLDKDGAVWWFRTKPFEDAAGEQWNRFKMRSQSGDHVDYNKFAFSEVSPPFIGTTYLRLPFPRLEAQQGLFTCAGRLGLLHDDLLCGLMHGKDFGKIVIPSPLKRDALQMLKTMNVTAKSLEHVGADRLGLRMSWDRTHGPVACRASSAPAGAGP